MIKGTSVRRRSGALLLASIFAVSAARAEEPIYKDLGRGFEECAAHLVSRMTLDAKVAQLQNDAAAIPRVDAPAYEWSNGDGQRQPKGE